MSAVRSSGSFQAEFPFSCHWRSTSCTCVRSTTPARSTLPSVATWASVPRIGPELITGEAIRTRRVAVPIAFAIRWASFSPRPGQNQARTVFPSTASGAVSTLPLFSTSRRVQSCSKSLAVARRELGRVDRDDHVLLARPRVGRPVRRAGPDGCGVADHVFVVHQVGDARDRGGRERQRLDRAPGPCCGGGGTGIVVGVVDVVGEPDRDAALGRADERAADDRRQRIRQPDVVDRDLERVLRPPR